MAHKGHLFYNIKTIRLKAGKHISYQLHHHRSEIWTCVDGEGIFVLDGERILVKRGNVMNIHVEHYHAIKATTDLTFIEVQLSNPLVEEDIERFEYEWQKGISLIKEQKHINYE